MSLFNSKSGIWGCKTFILPIQLIFSLLKRLRCPQPLSSCHEQENLPSVFRFIRTFGTAGMHRASDRHHYPTEQQSVEFNRGWNLAAGRAIAAERELEHRTTGDQHGHA